MGGNAVRFTVIYEAYRYWAMRWKEWIGVIVMFWLIGGLAAAVPVVACNVILVSQFGQVPTNGEHWFAALPVRIPAWTVATAVIWALSVGVYRSTFRHLRGAAPTFADVPASLRLFLPFLLPALAAQAVSGLACALALRWLPWPAIYLLNMAVQPFFAAPFLFALPMMAENGWGLREAASESASAIGPNLLAYGAVYWVLQALPYGTPYLVLLVPGLAPSWGVVALFTYLLMGPLPFLGVALLYRDRFPEPSAPPVMPT